MLENEKSKYDVIIEAPGRINLIGEHIDYNGGHVLPAAIDKRITLKFKKSTKTYCKIYSQTLDSSFEIDLKNLQISTTEWHNYIIGVICHIKKISPKKLEAFDCYIESSLAVGSGISSSAALECGIAKGLNELFEIGLTDNQLITISRDAEHSFVGTQCGIMDQFSVVKGSKEHLLLLNCETLAYELIKVDFSPYKLLLLNSNVSHNLAISAYNERREECQKALEILQQNLPSIKNLTHVAPKELKEFKKVLPEKIYERALFVSKENRRVLKAVKYLRKRKLQKFGKCMYQSHQGLKKRYEVSCKELDFLVNFTRDLPYVLGSRMMGGGFGGCTINVVHQDHYKDFILSSTEAYKDKFNIELTPINVNLDDGVRRKSNG